MAASLLVGTCGSVDAHEPEEQPGAGAEQAPKEATAEEPIEPFPLALPPPEPPRRSDPHLLEHRGASIAIPDGWDGRVMFLDAAGSAAVLQLASFRLLEQNGFDPPPELPPGEEDPIKAMSGEDVLVTLAPAGGASASKAAIASSDFLPPADPRIPRGHALAERSLCLETRCFELSVDFASAPDQGRIEEVNRILLTLSVVASEASRAATAPEADSHTQWLEYRSERHLSLRYPRHWNRAEEPLTPNLIDPREILALGTYPLRSGGERCSHMPVNALEDLGPSDSFIALLERAAPFPARGYPERPKRLSALLEDISDSGRFCVPDPERLDTWVSFSDGERAFYLLVALGKATSPETREELVAILDSIRLDSS